MTTHISPADGMLALVILLALLIGAVRVGIWAVNRWHHGDR